jgi:hypothetical protein
MATTGDPLLFPPFLLFFPYSLGLLWGLSVLFFWRIWRIVTAEYFWRLFWPPGLGFLLG